MFGSDTMLKKCGTVLPRDNLRCVVCMVVCVYDRQRESERESQTPGLRSGEVACESACVLAQSEKDSMSEKVIIAYTYGTGEKDGRISTSSALLFLSVYLDFGSHVYVWCR